MLLNQLVIYVDACNSFLIFNFLRYTISFDFEVILPNAEKFGLCPINAQITVKCLIDLEHNLYAMFNTGVQR